MEVIAIGWSYKRRQIKQFAIWIASTFIRDCYLQYTNFLSLSNNESVIVNSVITVHTLRKKGEVKTVSAITRLPSSLVPWRSLNWLNGWGRENISGIDCWNSCWQKWGGTNLTKVEKGIFGGDCRGGCMHS